PISPLPRVRRMAHGPTRRPRHRRRHHPERPTQSPRQRRRPPTGRNRRPTPPHHHTNGGSRMTEATAFALIAPTIPLALLATYALHGLTVRIARAYLRRQKMTI